MTGGKKKAGGAVTPDFERLTPDVVIDCVEAELGLRLLPLANPLPSYVNRVYGLQAEDGRQFVAKYYRPGRWPLAALHDEQRYVSDCAEAEIPVVAPLPLHDGETLGVCDGIAFALFPRRGGRPFDADGRAVWRRLGALLGRLHLVGATGDAPHRRDLHPDASTRTDLDYLLAGDFMPAREAEALTALGERLLDEIGPRFDDLTPIRLHGDCQRTNVLERPDEGLLLIDFDDMVNGPAVQDLWLLLPDLPEHCGAAIAELLESYETFMPFDRRTLALIEPLRAMRMIHYLAWCARQAGDARFRLAHPDWGTAAFWHAERLDLEQQLTRIHESLDVGDRTVYPVFA